MGHIMKPNKKMAFLVNNFQSLVTMDRTTMPLKAVNQISRPVRIIKIKANPTNKANSVEAIPSNKINKKVYDDLYIINKK